MMLLAVIAFILGMLAKFWGATTKPFEDWRHDLRTDEKLESDVRNNVRWHGIPSRWVHYTGLCFGILSFILMLWDSVSKFLK